jgi:hypothetical protein
LGISKHGFATKEIQTKMEKFVYCVNLPKSGCVLCITEDEDSAKRIAWNYNSYKDAANKIEEREGQHNFDEMIRSRQSLIKQWKFSVNSSDDVEDDIAEVIKIPLFNFPIKLIKGFMDSYTTSAYNRKKAK